MKTNDPNFDFDGLPSARDSVLAYRLRVPKDYSFIYSIVLRAVLSAILLFLYGEFVIWIRSKCPKESNPWATAVFAEVFIPRMAIFPFIVATYCVLRPLPPRWSNERLTRRGAKR